MCVLRQDRQRGEHKGRRRVAAVYGVLKIGIVPLGGVAFLIVGPPPGLYKKRAVAKLIGNSLRRGSVRVCVLRQERQRVEHEGRRRGVAVYGVSV